MSTESEDKHVANIQRKYQTLEGKRALLEMWEARRDPNDHQYLLELRRQITNLTVQLAAIGPGEG